MFQKVEHIGIAVKSLAISVPVYQKLLNTPCYKYEDVESEHVKTAFFQAGPNKIELLESTNPQSAISQFIEKRGEGIHHIAYSVANIHTEMERLQAQGFTLINAQPKKGADNKLVCFIHPKTTHGVLTELCQEIEN